MEERDMERRSSREHKERHLLPLEDLDDIAVAEDDPDVRGWTVLTEHRRAAGEVHTLIVDEAAMKVRYLDVAINRDFLEGTGRDHHHVLVPIGMARLDLKNNKVILDDFNIEDVIKLPSYEHGPVSQDYERRLRDTMMSDSEAFGSDNYYEQRHFDRERFYNRGSEFSDRDRPDDRNI
jgi:photosynthetic reaction center H subunit